MFGRDGRQAAALALRLALAGAAGLVSACATAETDQASGSTISDEKAVSPRSRDQTDPSAELRKDPTSFVSVDAVRSLELAEVRYRTIVADGGWPVIPSGGAIRLDEGDSRAGLLAQRLAASSDLPAHLVTAAQIPSREVKTALIRFQSRHGLKANGIADEQTIAALNMPAQSRLDQLRANLARVRDATSLVAKAKRYIVVNIPAFQLEAVEGSRVVQRHRVIVGKPDRQTPGVFAQIRTINLYPYWHVPESVARLDLIPRLEREPGYLNQMHIRVVNQTGQDVTASANPAWQASPSSVSFRQEPGPWNALGLIRLDMPNDKNVYMHDTPMKDLFGWRERTFSAGCVRVEGVADLAVWLLQDMPGWNRSRIESVLSDGRPLDVNLASPVPVVFVYLTAWAEPDGAIDFRPDVYGRDAVADLTASLGSPNEAKASERRTLSP